MPIVWFMIFMGLGVLALIGWWAWRDRKSVTAPACGQCHYPVRGLPTFTCPECGSDLREVGIEVPPRQRVAARRLAVVTTTVVVVGVIMLLALRLARSAAAVQLKAAVVQQQTQGAQARTVQSVAPGTLKVRTAPARADNGQANSSTPDDSP